MPRSRLPVLGILSLLAAGLALTSPALLAHPHGPPPGVGNPQGQNNRHEHSRGHNSTASAGTPGYFFTDQKRAEVNAYYARQFQRGHCPPGLARKHDGCIPPGLVRQWRIGQPLPVSVTTYPVPVVVISILGAPPDGYRYVRVANDILLMATGTRMVMDAVQDLGH